MVSEGSIFWFAFSKNRILTASEITSEGIEYFKKMHHELLQRNIYLGPSGYEVGFVSASHTIEDLEFAAKNICEVLDIIFK